MMIFTLTWLKDGEALGTMPFDELDQAIQYAKERFAIEKSRHGVTSVEVRDEYGIRRMLHQEN